MGRTCADAQPVRGSTRWRRWFKRHGRCPTKLCWLEGARGRRGYGRRCGRGSGIKGGRYVASECRGVAAASPRDQGGRGCDGESDVLRIARRPARSARPGNLSSKMGHGCSSVSCVRALSASVKPFDPSSASGLGSCVSRAARTGSSRSGHYHVKGASHYRPKRVGDSVEKLAGAKRREQLVRLVRHSVGCSDEEREQGEPRGGLHRPTAVQPAGYCHAEQRVHEHVYELVDMNDLDRGNVPPRYRR